MATSGRVGGHVVKPGGWPVLRPGDWVYFDGTEYQVIALAGMAVWRYGGMAADQQVVPGGGGGQPVCQGSRQ